MLAKGMPELGWWLGMVPVPSLVSCPSLGQPSPASPGKPWMGPVSPSLLCCSRDSRCQFQNVSSPGGSFPAVRLCNSYWSREVRGWEHGVPEDMAGCLEELSEIVPIQTSPDASLSHGRLKVDLTWRK